MYDFDVVFLMLSSPLSVRLADVLRLQDFAANTGFHTVIATSPSELKAVGRRLRVIVVDGDPESGFDVYAVTAAIRRFDNVAIIFLTDSTRKSGERGLEAGADICLPLRVDADQFCAGVIRLAHEKLYVVSINTDDSGATEGLATVDVVKNVLKPLLLSKCDPMLDQAGWKLLNNGWVLSSPRGISLRLTATERDLMVDLFTAEDKSVYHDQWDSRYGRISSDRDNRVSALSMVVGRLRRKWAQLNIKLPIFVKRGLGYWFVEECRVIIEADPKQH